MDTVNIKGKVYPYKMTKRVVHRLQKAKVNTEDGSVESLVKMVEECLREGHIMNPDNQKGGFDLSVDKLLAIDAEAEIGQSPIDEVIAGITENEKKPAPYLGTEMTTTDTTMGMKEVVERVS